MPLERWQHAWRVRLRILFDRRRADRELEEELRHHVALETEARCAQGVLPGEARRQALATLGGLASVRSQVRDAWFGVALEHVLQDVRYVLRVLRRNPGFTATTVLTLTLAISATTATFSVVDAVLLQPPPFPDADHLVTLWETDPENGNRPADPSPANFIDWRDQATGFEHVAALEPYSVDLTGARRAGGALRVAGHGGVLRNARRRRRPRADVPPRRVPSWQRRRRPHGRTVAPPLRRRPRHHRPLAGAGRRAVHGGGSACPGFRTPRGGRPKRPRRLPAQGHRGVRDLHSRRRLVARDRADPPGRHARGGPGRDGRGRGPACRRLSAHQTLASARASSPCRRARSRQCARCCCCSGAPSSSCC